MLNSSMVKDVLVNLLTFYADRFSSTIDVGDVYKEVDSFKEMDTLFIKGACGRDCAYVIIPKDCLCEKPHIARSISARRHNEKNDFFMNALSAIIRNLVFCLRTTPSDIMVREQHIDGSFTRWLCVGELAIGEILSNGLLAKNCTYVFKGNVVALFYDDVGDDNVVAYQFKAPVYYNNVFWFKAE